MTRNPITISADTPLGQALEMMIAKNLRHLPVMNGEKLLGVASDRDVYLAQIANLDLTDFTELKIGDVCTLDAYCVGPETPIADVVLEMAQYHIGSALITEDEKPVGIFTSTDACRFLGQTLNEGAASSV